MSGATFAYLLLVQIYVEALQPLYGVWDDEKFLYRDKRTLFWQLLTADLSLLLQSLNQIHALLQINALAKVVEHEVIVQEHVEKEVAAFSERYLIIDDGEELLSFGELLTTFLYASRILCQSHGISEHCLVCDESFLAEETSGKVHSFLRQQYTLLGLFLSFHLLEQDLDLREPNVEVLLVLIRRQYLLSQSLRPGNLTQSLVMIAKVKGL